MNLYRLFERQARHQPAKPALADHQRSYGFGALDLAAGRHAAALMRRGIRPGDRVGVILKEHADHIALNLAILRLGAAFAIIDWRAPPAERQVIGDTLGIAAALLEPQMPPLEGIASLAIDEAFHRTAAALEPAPVHAAKPGDAAMIALSSGTTGFPKGAIITHDQAFHRFVAGMMAFGWQAEDRYLACMPFCFSAGRDYPLHALMSGASVIVAPTLFTASDYVEMVGRHGITASLLSPTPLRWLLGEAAGKAPLLPAVRRLAVSGAPLHTEEKAAIYRQVAPGMIETLGTSATGALTRLAGEDLVTQADSMGRLLPLSEIEIVDRAGRTLPRGAEGIMRVRGPGTSTAMIGDNTGDGPASLREDGWFYPGDIVHLDEAGFLRLKGRSAELIIRGGANVYPAEIEKLLLTHPAVADAAVVGWPSAELGEEIAAFVTARSPVEAASLKQFCREHLAAYKVPRAFILMPDLPRTATGKVRKAELAARLTPL